MSTITAPVLLSATYGAVTVGQESALALDRNDNATYRAFFNISDEIIYIAEGNYAVVGRSTPVPPQVAGVPGCYEMSITGGNLFTGPVNCICTSGGKTLITKQGLGE